LLDRMPEALAEFEAILAQAPEREETLFSAAAVCGQLGRNEKALDYGRRLIAVNPWSARYHFEVARILIMRQEWSQAIAAAQKAVELHQFHFEARRVLVTALLQSGRRQQARAAFDELMALNPPDLESLRRSFPSLAR
jgi:tetratricopeptide (TPR) repeat protein